MNIMDINKKWAFFLVFIITPFFPSCEKSPSFVDCYDSTSKENKYIVCDTMGYMADFELGNTYYNRFINPNSEEQDSCNLKKAFACWKKSADCGYLHAQHCVGICYYTGKGVNIDYGRALEYFTLASVQGVTDSYYWLGLCYYNGQTQGSRKSARNINKSQAINYFKRAAVKGHAGAMYFVGIHYYEIGINAQKWDSKRAENYFVASYNWFYKASQANYKKAFYYLGLLSFTGNCGEEDLVKAFAFFKAAADGDARAQFYLGLFYEKGFGIVATNPDLAKEWYEKAALGGNSEAVIKLLTM